MALENSSNCESKPPRNTASTALFSGRKFAELKTKSEGEWGISQARKGRQHPILGTEEAYKTTRGRSKIREHGDRQVDACGDVV